MEKYPDFFFSRVKVRVKICAKVLIFKQKYDIMNNGNKSKGELRSMSKMSKWDHRFMQLTETVASWSSCFQENRHVGAIIVKDKRVMTTGYNGAPAGVKSCEEKGECLRRKLNIPSGTKHELCFAVHAEQNAIIQAAKYGINISGATLYCTHQPCVICAKMIINAGIKRVVYKEGYPDEFSIQLFDEANVSVEKYEE